MGWERRPCGGPYYTRSRKVGGRVVREYVGGGLIGEMAAAQDAEAQAKRETERAAWQAEQERYAALDGALTEFDTATDLVLRAALIGAGYYQHHRGEWRRRGDA